MSATPTLLRVLVAQRHWQKYETFATQYMRAANELAVRDQDPKLRGLSITKRQFERWLAGTLKTQPYPDHCRVLEYLFGHAIEDLFSPAPQPSGPAPAGADRTSALVKIGAEPSVPAILIGDTTSSEHPSGPPAGAPDGRSQDRPTGPRSQDIERELVIAARESSEHAEYVASHSIDPTDVEELHDDIVRLARNYAQTSPLLLYLDAKRARDRGFELLDRTKQTEQEHDLYLMIGKACGLLASLTFDLGSREAATEQARSAWIYGTHVGHNGLRAWARGMQSLITYWSGRPLEALALARDGQEYAPPGTAMVRLCCIEARAWSHLGDTTETARAIGAAHDARDQGNGSDELHDGIGGEFSFDEARQARCNGSAYLELGDAKSAIRETQRAIELFATTPRDRGWLKVDAEAHTDLSGAYLLQSQFDGARQALAPVFAIPQEHRIEGLTRRLGRVRHLLIRSPFRTAREARQLGEQIEDFTAHAAGRMLPSGPSSLLPS
jgi:tetratricopeptide (TPR) repeat protein